MSQLRKLSRSIMTFYIVITITIGLFVVLNISAALYLKSNPLDKGERDLFISENSYEGTEIRKKPFNTSNEELLKEYANHPGIRPHTVLHFTEGTSRPHYKIGIEGIRYLPNWTDDIVRNLLSQKDNLTFVFGGSTTFGSGGPDDSTLVAYLNSIDKKEAYINFGVQAYDAIREVDKLVYLLRKGYRPQTVIFVDGLNDVTTFARSPYEIHDTPRTQGLVLDRGEVPLIFGIPTRKNMLLALAYSFPITHLIYRLQHEQNHVDKDFIRKSANVHGMDWTELIDFHYNWSKIHRNKSDELANDIIRFYKENISFVRQLGESFGFNAHFIYQPIGLLENNQPFLTQKFSESDYFAIYQAVDSKIRIAINEGDLMMEDCSRAISKSGVETSYVDATHYSPRGNRLVAECIHQKTSATDKW